MTAAEIEANIRCEYIGGFLLKHILKNFLTYMFFLWSGLLGRLVYNIIADKRDASAKLKRVQAKIARKEALEKEQAAHSAENNMQKDK